VKETVGRWRRLRCPSTVVAGVFLSACTLLLPAPKPMRSVVVAAGGARSGLTFVLLAGRGGRPEDFLHAGAVERAAKAGIAADFVAADASLGYFLRRTVITRLHDDVVAPLQGRGTRRLWLVGVSLGGTVSLLYARQHPEEIDGILLLSPFLGERSLVEEIAASGGLEHWVPAATRPADDFQIPLWIFLQEMTRKGSPSVPLFLAYGDRDRFAGAQALLAAALPAERVIVLPGRHDWQTWSRLWESFLARPAARRALAAAPVAGGLREDQLLMEDWSAVREAAGGRMAVTRLLAARAADQRPPRGGGLRVGPESGE
jgi:pimeloyl-ACP methyl ester carboxylesterase